MNNSGYKKPRKHSLQSCLMNANGVNQTPPRRFGFNVKNNQMSFPTQTHVPDGCITLLSRMQRSVPVSARKLSFNGIGQRDVYRSEERRVGKECRSRWSPYH